MKNQARKGAERNGQEKKLDNSNMIKAEEEDESKERGRNEELQMEKEKEGKVRAKKRVTFIKNIQYSRCLCDKTEREK